MESHSPFDTINPSVGAGGVDISKIPSAEMLDAARGKLLSAETMMFLTDVPKLPIGAQAAKKPPLALSPDEVVLAGAFTRFMRRRPDVVKGARVDPKRHDEGASAHVILDQAGGGFAEVASVAKSGTTLLRAALTGRTDGVEHYVAAVRADPDSTYAQVESLKIAWRPVDIVYEREAQLAAGRTSTKVQRQALFDQKVAQEKQRQHMLRGAQRLKQGTLPAEKKAPGTSGRPGKKV